MKTSYWTTRTNILVYAREKKETTKKERERGGGGGGTERKKEGGKRRKRKEERNRSIEREKEIRVSLKEREREGL